MDEGKQRSFVFEPAAGTEKGGLPKTTQHTILAVVTCAFLGFPVGGSSRQARSHAASGRARRPWNVGMSPGQVRSVSKLVEVVTTALSTPVEARRELWALIDRSTVVIGCRALRSPNCIEHSPIADRTSVLVVCRLPSLVNPAEPPHLNAGRSADTRPSCAALTCRCGRLEAGVSSA